MLADRFHTHGRETNKNIEAVSVMADAAMLSPEEFGPLMELVAEADSFRDNPGGPVMRLLTLRWAMLDPKAALAFTMGRSELKSDNELLFSVVCELAKVDLPAAKAAVLTLCHEGWADAGPAVLRMLQEKDVQAALAYARELGSGGAEADVLQFMAGSDPMAAAAELVPGREEHLKVAETIAGALLDRDRAAFEAWAGSLSDPAQRACARRVALTADASHDPAKAARQTAAWLAS
ncbi:MAG: hypothetical protein EON95_14880, partial [Caulobacteraceae bacterium]